MKIAEMRGKNVAIKCVTQEEMEAVIEFLHAKVAWAYRESFLLVSAFKNGFIFLLINEKGGYTNFKGDAVVAVEDKILAKDFLEANKSE